LSLLNLHQKRDVCIYFENLYLGPVFNQTVTDADIVELKQSQKGDKKKKATSLFTRAPSKDKNSKSANLEKIENARKAVQKSEKNDLKEARPSLPIVKFLEAQSKSSETKTLQKESEKHIQKETEKEKDSSKKDTDKALPQKESGKASSREASFHTEKKEDEDIDDIPPPPIRESEAPPPPPRESELPEYNPSYKARSSSVQMPSAVSHQTANRKSFDDSSANKLAVAGNANVIKELSSKLADPELSDTSKKPLANLGTSKDFSPAEKDRIKTLSPVSEQLSRTLVLNKKPTVSPVSDQLSRTFISNKKQNEENPEVLKDSPKVEESKKNEFEKTKSKFGLKEGIISTPKEELKSKKSETTDSPKQKDSKPIIKAKASEIISKSSPTTPVIPAKSISPISEDESQKSSAVVSGASLSMQERRAAIKDMMSNLEGKGAPLPFGRQAAVPLALKKKKDRESLGGAPRAIIDPAFLAASPLHRSKSPSISSEDLVAKVDPSPLFRHRADTSNRLDKEVPAAPPANDKAKMSDLNDVLLSRPVVKSNRRAPKKKVDAE
jgi:hypothetical protein